MDQDAEENPELRKARSRNIIEVTEKIVYVDYGGISGFNYRLKSSVNRIVFLSLKGNSC